MESSGGQMKGVFLIKIFIPVIFALFFLNPPFAGAVETLALKPLLEEAKANNLELRAFTEKLKATEARAKVEGAPLTNDMIPLNSRKDIARERLKSLLNRARDAKMEEPPPLPKDRIEFATDELINAAVEKNPDIKLLASEAEQTEQK